MLKQHEGLEFDSKETSGAFLMKVVLKMAETSIFWLTSQEELAKLRPLSVVDITLTKTTGIWFKICLPEIEAAGIQIWNSKTFKRKVQACKGKPKFVKPKQTHLSSELWAHPLPFKALHSSENTDQSCYPRAGLHGDETGWKELIVDHSAFQRPALPRQQWQVEDAEQQDAGTAVSILCSESFMGSSAAELLPEAHRLQHRQEVFSVSCTL